MQTAKPLIAAVLAWAFLLERLGTAQYLGLAFGFLGILGISLNQLRVAQGAEFSIALAYIMLSVIGGAVSNVLMKAIRFAVDPLAAMAAQSLIRAIPLRVMAFVFERPSQIQATPPFVLALLSLVLPGTALASWFWFSILDRVLLGRANAFTFLIPFIAVGIGIFFFFDVRASAALIAGLVPTGLGVFLVEGMHKRSPPQDETLRK
ncbi:MAG: DMT family transporter [Pseudomonadota bacterium]